MLKNFQKILFLPSRSATIISSSTRLDRLSSQAASAFKPDRNQQKKLYKERKAVSVREFPLSYPDFLPSETWSRRDPLFEKLVYADMLERRMVLDVPEFYVGSIMAVTLADPNTPNRQNRFVGICIRRDKQGLQHTFTLRNVVDGLGVEVLYEMYNPTILKIETLLLEKRLDEDLTYLSDALPEYSTFNFHMEPVNHTAGKPIPVNPIKVKLKPPPWSQQWFELDLKGIEESWTGSTAWYKRRFISKRDLCLPKRFDIVRHYREAAQELEHDLAVQQWMVDFERDYANRVEDEAMTTEAETSRKILKSAAGGRKEISLKISTESD